MAKQKMISFDGDQLRCIIRERERGRGRGRERERERERSVMRELRESGTAKHTYVSLSKMTEVSMYNLIQSFRSIMCIYNT